MMNKSNHPFHLVDFSPWPLIVATAILSLTTSILDLMYHHNFFLFIMSMTLITMISTQWWRDVAREGKFQGLHAMNVVQGLKWGMILFIVSEILFFLSFFWTFFHASLTPSYDMGTSWPPLGLTPFNFLEIPMLNTIILLSSGITITWAHKSMVNNKISKAFLGLWLTIILGTLFTALQAFEYIEASYSFADSCYGASFFIATGFHGIHIIIGSLFLLVSLIRIWNNSFSISHHFGFEAASWYWHFVDVVWLFLFTLIYGWALT